MSSHGTIPTVHGENLLTSTPRKPWLRWSFVVALCGYYLLAYLFLVKGIPIFGTLFEGLEVELPLPTRLLIASYSWLVPVWCAVAVTFTIARQFMPDSTLRPRSANRFLIAFGVGFPLLVGLVLYLPLLALILKLAK